MKMQRWLLTMATAAALGLGANYCVAQNNNPPPGGGGGGGGGRGNFDPAQMRERIRITTLADASVGPSPNNSWGSGKVHALKAIVSTVAAISAPSGQ